MQNSNKKNNILIVTQKVDKSDPILGFFHRWVEEFAKTYKHVMVICLQKGKYDLPQNVKVMSLGKEDRVSHFWYILHFYQYIIPLLFARKKLNCIFIHMNEIYILLLIPLLPIRWMRNIPLYWWKAHGHLGLLSKAMRFFVDKIVTSSVSGFSVNTQKRVVVGQGIDTALFTMQDFAHEHTTTIIAVGRMSSVKHYEDLIIAVSLMKKTDSLKVHIVGLGVDEEKSEYVIMLKELISKHGLNDSVFLVPSVSNTEIVSLYQKSDILVNTSDTDSLDKVVLEAMSCGVIPVTSNIAYKQMLSSYGLFVKKRDTYKIAEVLSYIISLDSNKRASLRNDMRGIVVAEHDLKSLIYKLITK